MSSGESAIQLAIDNDSDMVFIEFLISLRKHYAGFSLELLHL